MLRILFIENSNDAIEDARQRIEECIDGAQIAISGFEDAHTNIQTFDPGIVILDLEGVPDSPTFEGFNVRDFIWENHFCPIVVYSAFVEDYEAEYEAHPLIKTVEKGSGSPSRVLSSVNDLLPVVQALQETQQQVEHRYWEAMKIVAPVAFDSATSPEAVTEVIIRCGRRRVAAMLDIPVGDEPPLASWEQYLSPPISQDPELGDVLMTAEGNADNPSCFRVILTPSCDMVSSNGRHPRVPDVLVAKCYSVSTGLEMIGMSGNGNSRHRNRIQTGVLNQGFSQSVIMFPRLIGAIPSMAANLRDLQLIPIDQIGPQGHFRRVATLDSPFKETIAWAYMQTSGRPGLPDRDTSSWAEEIVESMNEQGQGCDE